MTTNARILNADIQIQTVKSLDAITTADGCLLKGYASRQGMGEHYYSIALIEGLEGWKLIAEGIDNTPSPFISNKEAAKIADSILNWVNYREMQDDNRGRYAALKFKLNGSWFVVYRGQVMCCNNGNGKFHVSVGSYDYLYLPRLVRNMACYLDGKPIGYAISLNERWYLSRETIKTLLHRGYEANNACKPVTKAEFNDIFWAWLGNSSVKPKHWMHSDAQFIGLDSQNYRVCTIGNGSKDMITVSSNGETCVFFGKNAYLVKGLPKVFYDFARQALTAGKDYTLSGTGYELTW
jgi:hypothetical protein